MRYFAVPASILDVCEDAKNEDGRARVFSEINKRVVFNDSLIYLVACLAEGRLYFKRDGSEGRGIVIGAVGAENLGAANQSRN